MMPASNLTMGQRAKKFATLLFAFGFALTLYGFIRGSYATRAPGPIICAIAIFIMCCDCNGGRVTCDFTTTSNNNTGDNGAAHVAVIERRRSTGSMRESGNFSNVSPQRRSSLLPPYDSLPPSYYVGQPTASNNRNKPEDTIPPPPSYPQEATLSPSYSVAPHESPPSYDNT